VFGREGDEPTVRGAGAPPLVLAGGWVFARRGGSATGCTSAAIALRTQLADGVSGWSATADRRERSGRSWV
jgi:hypothetical protein